MQSVSNLQKVKQIIVINASLSLSKEKVLNQMIQASAGAFMKAAKNDKNIWLEAGMPQVLLKAVNNDDLQDLIYKAEQNHLPICQIEANTHRLSASNGIACLGIGPALDIYIDQLAIVLNLYGWLRQTTPSDVRLFA